MSTFKINYDDVKVEEIMAKIKAKIKEKREEGVYDKLLEQILAEKYSGDPRDDLYTDLSAIRGLSMISFDYPYTSHRPLFGGFIILIKKIFRLLYKIALKPVYQKQESYNALVAKVLSNIVDRIHKLEKE